MSEIRAGYRADLQDIISRLHLLSQQIGYDVTRLPPAEMEQRENTELLHGAVIVALEYSCDALNMVKLPQQQPKGVTGMDNIKKILGAIFTAAEDVAETMADGEVSVLDVLNFKDSLNAILGLLMDYEEIFSGVGPEIEAIRAEPAKLQELNAWAKQDFDLPQDHLEELVEQFMDGGVKILAGLATIMNARKSAKQSESG